MNTNELTQYLHTVYDVESRIYEMQQMQRTIRLQGENFDYDKPAEASPLYQARANYDLLRQQHRNLAINKIRDIEPFRETRPSAPNDSIRSSIVILWVLYTVIVVLPSFVILVAGDMSFALNMHLVLGIPALIYTLYLRKKINKQQETYQNELAAYERAREKWEERREARFQERDQHQQRVDEARIAMDKAKDAMTAARLALKDEVWAVANTQIDALEESLAVLYQTRRQLYDMNVIFPKYRTLPCVATMLEYLQAGRVTELTGPSGAYNLYESELRANLIIAQLDKVLTQLEQIKQNQYNLYQAVSAANRTLNTISGQLQKQINLQVASNAMQEKSLAMQQQQVRLAAVTASCSAATAANTQALKYLALVN